MNINIECEGPGQGDRIGSLWRRFFALEKAGSQDADVRFLYKSPGNPLRGSTPVERIRDVSGLSGLSISKSEDGFVLQYGTSELDVDVTRGCAIGMINDDFWGQPAQGQRELFHIAFMMLLRPHGLYGLHANGVSREGKGLLIAGSPGSGKTTLSLALIRQAWSYLSDDSVIMRRGARGIEALPVRRGFSITSNTMKLFPELASAAESSHLKEGKRLIYVDHIYPNSAVSLLGPRVVLFPQRTSQKRSRLIPIDEKATLFSLVQHSAGIMTQQSLAGKHLDFLSLLVRQLRGYQMLAGTDVYEDSAAVSELIWEACRDE